MNQAECKVMFVCLGNICRSPAAECVLRTMAKKSPAASGVVCASSGLASYHVGEPADPGMIGAGKKRRYFIEGTARLFKPEDDLRNFDRVIAMDRTILNDVMKNAKRIGLEDKVSGFIEYCKRFPDLDGVPDPYFNSAFEHSWDIIEDGCEGLLKQILA